MALTKETEIAKIEVVGQHKAVQVRTDTVVKEDGTEISRSFHRHVLHPDQDISGEHADVQAVCNTVWTDAVKSAWADYKASI
jgi:hypothetical protein